MPSDFQNSKQWAVCETFGGHLNNFLFLWLFSALQLTSATHTMVSQNYWLLNDYKFYWFEHLKLNKFEIVSHFRREALEKENFLFPGFSFFFISLLMMCYNFSSNLNQGASVILREYSLPILGRATDTEMQTMCKNFILQFRMKLLYLEWITLKKNRWTVSATQFLCNQNTGFILWSLCNQNLNFYSCTSQEVDESLGYYLNNKQWAWNKLSTEDWGESMLSSLVVLRNSCCDLFYSIKHVQSKLPLKIVHFILQGVVRSLRQYSREGSSDKCVSVVQLV